MTKAKTTVEYNLFERCDGEIEIISNKSCDNIYRYNTFRDCKGQLTLRHGNRCRVEGNFFLQNHKKGSSGVRIIGEDHTVINNYSHAIGNKKGSDELRAAVAIMNGVPDSPLDRYFQVKNALVAFNTFVDCDQCFTVGTRKKGTSLPPLNCVIANNIVLSHGSSIIQYTTKPFNLRYQGNIMFGSPLGINPNKGIEIIDSKLVKGKDGLWRPTADSPARTAARGSFPTVTLNIDGQFRPTKTDVGCDQLSDSPTKNRPLTSADVGPEKK